MCDALKAKGGRGQVHLTRFCLKLSLILRSRRGTAATEPSDASLLPAATMIKSRNTWHAGYGRLAEAEPWV
jgi:hypothetical protein